MDRANRLARQLDAGSVNINDTMAHYPVSLLPFGGVKKSGNARTHGKQELLQFTQLRSYAVGRPPLPIDLATQMRKPGKYHLGAAIMRLMFGVTPRQRIQPLVDTLGLSNLEKVKKSEASKVAALLGLAAAIAATILGIFRFRK